jgi:hypothetical protein
MAGGLRKQYPSPQSDPEAGGIMRHTPLRAALLLALSATPILGQGAQTAKPIEGVTWYTASYVKFKPGMADEARKIIYEHFWPVDKEIGREVIPFDNVTGEWDHVVYLPMPGGPAELAFQETPLGKRWRETFFRREGGKEKAEALEKRFSEMVLHERTEIVMKRFK